MSSPIFRSGSKIPARNPLLYKDLRAFSCLKRKVVLFRKGAVECERDDRSKEWLYTGFGGLIVITTKKPQARTAFIYLKAKEVKSIRYKTDPLTLKWLMAGVELSELFTLGVMKLEWIKGKKMDYESKNRKVMNINDMWAAYQGWYDWQKSSSDLPFWQFMHHKNPKTTMAVLDKRLLRRIGLSTSRFLLPSNRAK